MKRLKRGGWELDRVRGDHHIFKHDNQSGIVVLPHPKKDIAIGTWVAIQKQAGWR